MARKKCAGYLLKESLPTTVDGVQHWRGEGDGDVADIYIGDVGLRERAGSLPKWGPFAKFIVGEDGDGVHVIVPGGLARNLSELGNEETPDVAMGVALHIATAVAELHERGGSHGGLHPDFIGVDASGRLVIRPYLGGTAIPESDPDASAQATDCLQCAALLDGLQIHRLDDTSVALVSRGLRREVARRRIQPGRAVRQSLSAVASHQLWQSACSCGDGPRAAMESSVYHNIAVGLVHAMIEWFDASCKRPRRNGDAVYARGGLGGGEGGALGLHSARNGPPCSDGHARVLTGK